MVHLVEDGSQLALDLAYVFLGMGDVAGDEHDLVPEGVSVGFEQ